MNRKPQTTVRILMILLFASVGLALGADYNVPWHTVDGGGYELAGGFWVGVVSLAPPEPGDCDADGDVDLDDYVGFSGCLSGPGNEVGAGCSCADFDADGDVDLADFAAFQLTVEAPPVECITGPSCACNGDVNGDGIISSLDVAIIYICNGQPASACPGEDVNCDGWITDCDAAVAMCQFGQFAPGDPACCD